MRVIDRALLRRFLTELLRYSGLLAGFGILVSLARATGRSEGVPVSTAWSAALARVARVLDLSVAIAAPLAILRTLSDVARQGPLFAACAAGYSGRDFRRLFVRVALVSVAMAAVLRLAGLPWSGAARPGSGRQLWSGNGVHALCLDYEASSGSAGKVLLFDDQDLAITAVDRARFDGQRGAWTSSPPQRLAGDRIVGSGSIPLPVAGVRRSTLDIEGPWSAVSAVNRLCLGACLAVLAAYVWLALAVEAAALAAALVLASILAAGCLLVRVHVLLWQRHWAGALLEAMVWLAWIALVVALGRRFTRRGLRWQ